MLKKIKIAGFGLLCILTGHLAHAQISASPYTIQGIGEPLDMGLIHNRSTGGVGIGGGRPFHINNLNPALLPLNSVTSFEIAALGERRNISQGELSQEHATLNIGYLAFAFPAVRGRWTVSAGLKPYSVVDYNIRTRDEVVGSSETVDISVSGAGGLNQAYFATGVRLYENLFIGLRAGYLFGSINDQTTVGRFVIEDEDSVHASGFEAAYYRRTSFADFSFGAGMAYRMELSDRLALSVGGIYDLETDVSTTRHERLNRLAPNGDTETRDTLIAGRDGITTLPARYGVGIALNNGVHWMAAVDFQMQDWSAYRNYNRESGELRRSYKVAAGFDFIPDYDAVSGYFKRVFYRTGFYYQQTPFVKNNQQIGEFGINFGVGLPVTGGSLINLHVGYSQRGFEGGTVIREDILNFGLGVTFNDQRWFIRRKYD